mgnify:CR=1 FL=1
MSKLGAVIEAVEKHEKFVHEQVKRARTDEKFGREMTERWSKIKAGIPIAHAPTGLPLPRLALPEIDEAGRSRVIFSATVCRGISLFEWRLSGDVSRTAA